MRHPCLLLYFLLTLVYCDHIDKSRQLVKVAKVCKKSMIPVISNVAFTSPEYPEDSPSLFPCSETKRYFETAEGFVLKVNCTDFEIYDSDYGKRCHNSYLQFSDGPNHSDRLCGDEDDLEDFTTRSNKLIVKYGSSYNSQYLELYEHDFRFNCSVYVLPDPQSDLCPCGLSGTEERQRRSAKLTRIIGGDSAEIGEYPWQVSIFLDNIGSGGFWCAGALIHEYWVITAAQCVLDTVEGTHVIVGDYNIIVDEPNELFIDAAEIIVHPEFDFNFDYDIALIKLAEAVPFNKYRRPVCLPIRFQNVDFSNQFATTTGWGFDVVDVLQELRVDILTNEECLEASPNIGLEIVTNRMMCTQADNPGNTLITENPCILDEGNPLVWKNVFNGRYYLLGLLTFPFGCGFEDGLTAYTRVSEFIDWIQENTGDAVLCDPPPSYPFID